MVLNLYQPKSINMSQIKAFISVTSHDASADKHFKIWDTYDEAVDEIHKFFESYDFEVRNNKPYDAGNASFDNDEEGYDVFDWIKMHNGKVAQFTHCDGDGPVAYISKPEDQR